MSDAPERIWAIGTTPPYRVNCSVLDHSDEEGCAEYVRADLFDALAKERDEQRELKEHARKCCDEAEAKAAALADEAGRLTRPIRTGDTVYHMPSQEEWLVAWADPKSGYMAPCGWPECQAKISDCVVIKRASDDEAEKLIADLEKSGRRDANRARALLAQAKEQDDGK